jgi:predicted Rossmann-fold nucleotide-binding protein
MMIISGGQTGVYRAALDVAIQLGIPHGGFVPKGRLAEDGKLSHRYKVKEMASKEYSERTRANVDWANATLVIFRGRLMGGTLLTWEYAKNRNKAVLPIDLASESTERTLERIEKWLAEKQPEILNIAGPRESTHPGIYAQSFQLLVTALEKVSDT